MCGDDNVDDDDIDDDKVMMTMPIDDAGFCWLFFVFLLVDILNVRSVNCSLHYDCTLKLKKVRVTGGRSHTVQDRANVESSPDRRPKKNYEIKKVPVP